jgi:hypothetical protein
MLSAVITDLAAWSFLARLFGRFHLDCRELFYPSTQVAGEHKGAAATFDGS